MNHRLAVRSDFGAADLSALKTDATLDAATSRRPQGEAYAITRSRFVNFTTTFPAVDKQRRMVIINSLPQT
jgi:hypothetical protein